LTRRALAAQSAKQHAFVARANAARARDQELSRNAHAFFVFLRAQISYVSRIDATAQLVHRSAQARRFLAKSSATDAPRHSFTPRFVGHAACVVSLRRIVFRFTKRNAHAIKKQNEKFSRVIRFSNDSRVITVDA
jgi:hypothetical protein